MELLIVGAGVRPRQELAEACGLELGARGGVKAGEGGGVLWEPWEPRPPRGSPKKERREVGIFFL